MKVFVDDSILIKGEVCAAYAFKSPYSAAVIEKIEVAGMEITDKRSDAGAVLLPYCKYPGYYYIKPTYGTVSRFGVVADASSMDQVHIGAEKLDDAFAVLSVVAGHDPRDGTSYPAPKYEYAPFDGEVKTTDFDALRFKYADCLEAVCTIIYAAEFSGNIARFDGLKFGCERDALPLQAKVQALLGTYVLSDGQFEKYYYKATQVRRLIKQELDKVFGQFDVIRMPSSVGLSDLTGNPALLTPSGDIYIAREFGEGFLWNTKL